MDNMDCFNTAKTSSVENASAGKLLDVEYVIQNALPKGSENAAVLRRLAEEGKEVIQSNDPYTINSWLSERNRRIPCEYLRLVLLSMEENGKFSPFHLIWLWSFLTERTSGNFPYNHESQDDNNVISAAQVIYPIERMLLCPGFQWEYLTLVESAEDFVLLASVMQCGGDEETFKQAKKYSIEPDFVQYFTSPDFSREAFEKAENKNAFLKCMHFMFFTEVSDFAMKYYGRLPDAVLSALMVLVKLGAPSGTLDELLETVGGERLWGWDSGFFQNVVFYQDAPLTKEHYKNLLIMLQVLCGAPEAFSYGNSPAWGYMRKLTCDYLGKEFKRGSSGTVIASWNEKYYFNPAHSAVYAFPEGAAPFIWKHVASYAQNMFKVPFLDTRITKGRENKMKTVIYTAIGMDGRTVPMQEDGYSIYPFYEVLNSLEDEDSLTLIKDMLGVGKSVNCYDPYLCFSVLQLLEIEAPLKFWLGIYLKNPLFFDTCVFKALLAIRNGAVDYVGTFQNPEDGIKELLAIARTISGGYNKATAALFQMFIDNYLDIRVLPVSFSLKGTITLEADGQVFRITTEEMINKDTPEVVGRLAGRKLEVQVQQDVLTIKAGGQNEG